MTSEPTPMTTMAGDWKRYRRLDDPKGGFDFEPLDAYIVRIQREQLPHFPADVLEHWFYRHANSLNDYAWLEYETFRFEMQEWEADRVPAREAFANKPFFDNLSTNFQWHLNNRFHDWLAHWMNDHGTWPVPIVLLDNATGLVTPDGDALGIPYHLLEGHRRLSFFHALKREGRVKDQHKVWLVRRTVEPAQ